MAAEPPEGFVLRTPKPPEGFVLRTEKPQPPEGFVLREESNPLYKEIPTQVLGGVRDALQQNSKLAEQALTGPLKYSLPGLAAQAGKAFTESNPEIAELAEQNRELPEVAEPTRLAGQITRPLAQFSTDFIPLFKAIRSFGFAKKLTGGAGVAATLGEGELAGLLADQIAFDPHDPRLSNLVQEYPALQNPITEYLAADPNDSEAKARLKVALEGTILSAIATPIVEGVGAGIRGLRGAKPAATETAENVRTDEPVEDVAPPREDVAPEPPPGFVMRDTPVEPAPLAQEARSTRSAQPEHDTLLQALSKITNSAGQRGLSREAAASMGLDPANFATLGHGINRPFTQGGMSLDDAAERLAVMGYPVRDAEGNYDPNALMDRIFDELSGKPVYSNEVGDNVMEQMYRDSAESRYGGPDSPTFARLLKEDEVLDWYNAHPGLDPEDIPPRYFDEGDYLPDMDEAAKQLADLGAIARDYDLDATVDALSHPDPDVARSSLIQVINAGKRNAQGTETATGQTVAARTGQEDASAPRGSAASEIGERRENLVERQRIDQLSPEETRRLLMTSEVSGIPNRRAYADAPKQPVQVAIDVDSLKYVNDNLGHAAGDELLQKVGRALNDEGLDAYHISGDEFVVQGVNRAEIESALTRVQARLGSDAVSARGKSVAPGFSYGVGPTLDAADEALQGSKQAREATGERAARGDPPPGFVIDGAGRGGVPPSGGGPSGPSGGIPGGPEEFLSGNATDTGNINLAKFENPGDIKRAIAETQARYAQEIGDARRGVVTHEETQQLADALGMTVEDLAKRKRGQAFNAHELRAALSLLNESARTLEPLARTAVGGTDSQILEFRRAWARHAAIQEYVSGAVAEAGRALNILRAMMPKSGRVNELKDILEQFGGRDTIEGLAEAINAIDDPVARNAFIRDANKATKAEMFKELWYNFLLSGPKTHAVNILSNSIFTILQVPETAIAAGIGAIRRGSDRVYGGEVMARVFGATHGMRDGLKFAARAFATEELSDVTSKIEAHRPKAIPSYTLRPDAKPKEVFGFPVPFTGPIDVGGKQLRLSSRALSAEDEFFKVIGYRMEVHARALRTGRQKGLKGKDLAEHIDSVLRDPPEDVHLAAIDNARYLTFTEQLGTLGKGVQGLVKGFPGGFLLMPFVRVVTNLVSRAVERTPAFPLLKSARDNLRAGGAARDIQLARFAMGGLISSVVVSLSLEGKITGSGPSDYNAKANMRETGWQPYSLKIGDKYYAYNRVDPLGMVMGLTADLAEIYGQVPEKEIEEIAVLLSGSVAKNITSKTWLRGLSEAVSVMDDPDRYGERFFQNYVGTLIPTGVAQYAQTQDPMLRQVETMLDKIKSRLPGYSETLPPRLNVWGEPIILSGGLGPDMISPVYTSTDKNDKVAEEIVRLEAPVSLPDRKIQGVELTPEEYNRYVELAGKPAKQILDRIVSTPEYDQLPDFAKKELIMKTMMRVREQARAAMLPTLGAQRIVDQKLERLQ